MGVALAGTTGYLGKHIAKELNKRGIAPTVLTRRWGREDDREISRADVKKVDFLDEHSLSGTLRGIDVVISSLGITRQKDNLTYMDVDYQANLNLLNEAVGAGVNKFIYISALHGQNLQHINIFEAKEKFVDALKNSGLDYVIIRPTGFFSDMKDFLDMARSGRIYLFGKGEKKLNPIDGKDLAEFCIDAVTTFSREEVEVGGPEIYTHTELAHLAFKSIGADTKIVYIPDIFRKIILWSLPYLMSSKKYGPIEFFLTVMNLDMVASPYGTLKIEEFYKKCNAQ